MPHQYDPAYEARELALYRRVFVNCLGRPTQTRRTSVGGNVWPTLNCYDIWDFHWGDAVAGAHPKDETVSGSFAYMKAQQLAFGKPQPPSLFPTWDKWKSWFVKATSARN